MDKNLSENFFIAENGNRIVAFIFFEFSKEIKAIPFIHKPKNKIGKYIYVSEVGVLDEFVGSVILQNLFDIMKTKAANAKCRGIIWLTGSKNKHDMLEQKFLVKNCFVKKDAVINWEAYPEYYVNDHYLRYLGYKKIIYQL